MQTLGQDFKSQSCFACARVVCSIYLTAIPSKIWSLAASSNGAGFLILFKQQEAV